MLSTRHHHQGIIAGRWLWLAVIMLLSMQLSAQESHVIYRAVDGDNHYANGAVLTALHDTLYCMWQTSPVDEDSPNTSVVYSRSTDQGCTWEAPITLAQPTDSTYCTSGGWLVDGDTLTAFINVWPLDLNPRGGFTYHRCTVDGQSWTDMLPVLMADGSTMNGVIEQDPYPMASGRIVGACHFQPGLHVCPVYTDHPSGRRGWQRAEFQCEGNDKQSRFLEPSQYLTPGGILAMIFRDQQSTFRKYISFSSDQGESWTMPTQTNLLDARTKQCAGNLPDGTSFMVSCPSDSKQRWPLVLQLSTDGITFPRTILLRSEQELPPRQFAGKAKTLGYSYPKAFVHHQWLYVVYSVNKEDIVCTRISLKDITRKEHYIRR